ncbi:MAG: tetratricopeptide repeat protein [bacterium]
MICSPWPARRTKHIEGIHYGNLGLAYAGLGEKARALECLNKALEIDPDYEVAIVNKALVERLDQGERIEGNIESVDYRRRIHDLKNDL